MRLEGLNTDGRTWEASRRGWPVVQLGATVDTPRSSGVPEERGTLPGDRGYPAATGTALGSAPALIIALRVGWCR